MSIQDTLKPANNFAASLAALGIVKPTKKPTKSSAVPYVKSTIVEEILQSMCDELNGGPANADDVKRIMRGANSNDTHPLRPESWGADAPGANGVKQRAEKAITERFPEYSAANPPTVSYGEVENAFHKVARCGHEFSVDALFAVAQGLKSNPTLAGETIRTLRADYLPNTKPGTKEYRDLHLASEAFRFLELLESVAAPETADAE